MHNEYQDSPAKVAAWMDSLAPRDKALFNAGALVALELFLEQICASKCKLLDALVDEEDPVGIARLESKINLLDVYEQAYRVRAKQLGKDAALQAICWPIYA